MIPKVQACLETLDKGVRKIHIIDGRLRHSLLLEIFTNKGVGTEIDRDDERNSLDGRQAAAQRQADRAAAPIAHRGQSHDSGNSTWLPRPNDRRNARALPEIRHSQLRPLPGRAGARRGIVCLGREGNRYLDFFPGWGCNLLGHCPAPVVEAVREQVGTLIHVPNTWHTEAQGLWAKALSERSFGGQAFFCNSGAEANEAAIKLVRLHTPKQPLQDHHLRRRLPRPHAGLARPPRPSPSTTRASGPLMAGFVYAPFGDLDAVARLIDAETAAIMIEPIQGEGGVRIPPDGFLAGLRKLADEHGLLLVFDEVQTGCGRTGQWFAYQHFGVTPDIMTLAKAVCGGIAGGGHAGHGPRSPPACGPACTRPRSAAIRSPPGPASPPSK